MTEWQKQFCRLSMNAANCFVCWKAFGHVATLQDKHCSEIVAYVVLFSSDVMPHVKSLCQSVTDIERCLHASGNMLRTVRIAAIGRDGSVRPSEKELLLAWGMRVSPVVSSRAVSVTIPRCPLS